MNKSKTIFCDIDGTLWFHEGFVSEQALVSDYKLLPNTISVINNWDKHGYNIILTTGRKESLRGKTEEQLLKFGIVYDSLIMGIGGGDRILINDRKKNGLSNTCYAINVVRNKGIQYYDFTNDFVVIDNQEKEKKYIWGSEEIIDYNDQYIVKKIYLNNNTILNLKYHEIRKKTIYILEGKIKIYYGKNIDLLKVKILLVNDSFTIKSHTMYKIESIHKSVYIECSTIELWDSVNLDV